MRKHLQFAILTVNVLVAGTVAAQTSAPASTQPAPGGNATTQPTSRPAGKMKYSREYWSEAEGGKLKFEYEMRQNAEGKWMRNGKSRAFYANGTMEREGVYKDNKRVGVWNFYNVDGSFNRTTNFGGLSTDRPADTQPTSQPDGEIGEEVNVPGLPPGVKLRRVRPQDLPPGVRPPNAPSAPGQNPGKPAPASQPAKPQGQPAQKPSQAPTSQPESKPSSP